MFSLTSFAVSCSLRAFDLFFLLPLSITINWLHLPLDLAYYIFQASLPQLPPKNPIPFESREETNGFKKMEGYLWLSQTSDMPFQAGMKELKKQLKKQKQTTPGPALVHATILEESGILKTDPVLKNSKEKPLLINLRDFKVQHEPANLDPGHHCSLLHPIHIKSNTADYYIHAPTPLQKEQWFQTLKKQSEPQVEEEFQKWVPTDIPQADCFQWFMQRIYFGFHQSDTFEQFLKQRIQQKLNRAKKPSYISDMKVAKVHAPPKMPEFKNFRMAAHSKAGDFCFQCDLSFESSGKTGFMIDLELDFLTQAAQQTEKAAQQTEASSEELAETEEKEETSNSVLKLNLTMHLKQLKVPLIWIFPPFPSQTFHFSFEKAPEVLEMEMENISLHQPGGVKVSKGRERVLKMAWKMVKDAVKNKMEEILREGLVYPQTVPIHFGGKAKKTSNASLTKLSSSDSLLSRNTEPDTNDYFEKGKKEKKRSSSVQSTSSSITSASEKEKQNAADLIHSITEESILPSLKLSPTQPRKKSLSSQTNPMLAAATAPSFVVGSPIGELKSISKNFLFASASSAFSAVGSQASSSHSTPLASPLIKWRKNQPQNSHF